MGPIINIVREAEWNGAEHLVILGAIAAMTAVYALFIHALLRSERLDSRDRSCPRWFLLAMAAFYIAEAPPLHQAAEEFSLSAHMVQHFLMIVPLPVGLLRSVPQAAWTWITDRPFLLQLLRRATTPLVAFLVFQFVFHAWHVPVYYEAALAHHWLHGVEHVTFIVGAMLMWWPLLSPHPGLSSLQPPQKLIYLFGLTASQVAISGPLTMHSEPVYPYYETGTAQLGIPILLDQQMAGVLMKFPTMILFGAMFFRVFWRWAKAEEEV